MEGIFYILSDHHYSHFLKDGTPELMAAKGEMVEIISDHQNVSIVKRDDGLRFSIPNHKLITYAKVKPKTKDPELVVVRQETYPAPGIGEIQLSGAGSPDRKSPKGRAQNRYHANSDTFRKASGPVPNPNMNQQTLF